MKKYKSDLMYMTHTNLKEYVETEGGVSRVGAIRLN